MAIMSLTLDENENTTLRFAAIYILLSSFSPLDGGRNLHLRQRLPQRRVFDITAHCIATQIQHCHTGDHGL